MKITAVNIYRVNIPFKMAFTISQRKAKSADNIIVELLSDKPNLRGYGEGAPRPYVTGETQNTSIDGVRSLCRNKHFPWDLKHANEIWEFVDGSNKGKKTNAALCATEMALLDILGKEEARNIKDYLPGNYGINEIRYGAAVPIGMREQLLRYLNVIRKYRIKDVRLKMGDDYYQNKSALRLCRQVIGPEVDLLVDVNMAWNLRQAIIHLPLLETFGVKILEQPLPPNDPDLHILAMAAKETNLILMADESVCTIKDLENVIQDGHFGMINIRLSKCGGFHRSLSLIKRIRKIGLKYQVGCQLGESGILSAAGRSLCAVSSDSCYYTGSYDAFMLDGNLTDSHLTFEKRGKALPLVEPGLGVTVSPYNLAKYSDYFVTEKSPRLTNKTRFIGEEALDYGFNTAF